MIETNLLLVNKEVKYNSISLFLQLFVLVLVKRRSTHFACSHMSRKSQLGELFDNTALSWPQMVQWSQNILRVPYYYCWLKENSNTADLWKAAFNWQTPWLFLFLQLILSLWIASRSATGGAALKGNKKAKTKQNRSIRRTHMVLRVVVELVLTDGGSDGMAVQTDSVPTRRVTRVFTTCKTTQRIYLVQLWGRCQYLQRPRDRAARIRWKVASSVSLWR